jgi:hypothetical protein
LESLKGRHYSEEFGADGRTVLKLILWNYVRWLWIRFFWLRATTCGDSCDHCVETSGSIKGCVFLDLASEGLPCI